MIDGVIPDQHETASADAWAARAIDHAPTLLRFARAFTPNEADAEDLVQEALLRGLRARHDFRGEASELSWLRRILRNLAIDRARKPVREISVDEVEADWRDDAYTVDAAAVAESLETRDDLWDALSRLPHGYRAVVVLHDIEGWTVTEIADAFDLGLPAAKQRLRRGRMAVVSALGETSAHRAELIGVPLRCWDARRHVSDYLDDTLDPATRASVEAHLERCPTCPALVASLVGATDALAKLRDPDSVLSPELTATIRDRLTVA